MYYLLKYKIHYTHTIPIPNTYISYLYDTETPCLVSFFSARVIVPAHIAAVGSLFFTHTFEPRKKEKETEREEGVWGPLAYGCPCLS